MQENIVEVICSSEEGCEHQDGAYCRIKKLDCAFADFDGKSIAEIETQTATSTPEIVEAEPPATAIISVKPEIDEAVIALYKQSLKLEQYAGALVIASDDNIRSATNDLSIISGLKKAIEEKRKEYTQPINDHLKAINEAFKTFTEPLDRADRITRDKVLEYRQEQERRRKEAEEIARLEREAAEMRAALTGEPVVVPEVVEAPAVAPDHYRAEMGTLGKATIWKFEVIDFALVPDEYKIVDAGKVGRVVRAGLRSIPGIRIYSGESLRVTTQQR